MHKSVTDSSLKIFLLLFFSIFLTSCFEPTPTQPKPPEPPVETVTVENVPADGILEAVTWNIECFGFNSFCSDGEIEKQTNNILTVIDTLNADLFAFQEVADLQALEHITTNMENYQGFVAEEIGQSQKTAFVYNTNVIKPLSSGLIKQNQNKHDWAGGRFPFYFKFEYTAEDTIFTVYAVVIHAKAGADADDYSRRRDAAQSLYNYFINSKPDANIIFLGDYNDDVDVSIYNGEKSPYEPFIIDNASFMVVSMEISENGQTTYIGYDDAIDHITISNELFDEYIPGSVKALTDVTEWLDISVNQYKETTTSHYPVWAKFNL